MFARPDRTAFLQCPIRGLVNDEQDVPCGRRASNSGQELIEAMTR